MLRRGFLQLLAGAFAAPAIPPGGSAAGVARAASYNRYQYGLAVFHARTRASISAADLMQRLRVSVGAAERMISEMHVGGVVTPTLNAASGAMRAVAPNGQSHRVGEALERLVDLAGSSADDGGESAQDLPENSAGDEVGRTETQGDDDGRVH